MQVPELSAAQRTLIEVAFTGFRTASRWPTAAYVDAVLDHDHGLDYEAILSELPRSVAIAEPGYGQQSLVKLTVAGLQSIADATADLENFVALVRAAAQRESGVQPEPTGTEQPELMASDADGIWGRSLGDGELARVLEIANLEGITAGFRGPDDEGNWSIGIGRWIRAFRGIRSVDDYLSRKPEPMSQSWEPPPSAAPYIFILMPFGASWSDDVKAAMDLACVQVSKRFSGLTWERADEITDTGRITDQIITAIERANVLIADITGTNPNVLFELGYADALGRAVIVLNQTIGDTPFDIKDWRQIEYGLDDITSLGRRLADFLAASLRRQGFPVTA